MKKLILSTVVLSALSAGLVGCGFNRDTDMYDKDAAVGAQVAAYQGKAVKDSDLTTYRKDPRHVFVYDGVKYRVKSYRGHYVYYRV